MGCLVWSFSVSMCLSAQLLIARDVEVSDWCEEGGSCESPIPSAEHILLQTSKKHDAKIPKIKASSVPLTEDGYKMILKLKNEHEMTEFIKRAASEFGFEITEEAKLNGVVPYYSGKKAAQSFAALTSEMDRTSKVAKGWAKRHGKKSRHAEPSVESGDILLQTNHHVVANRSEVMANRTNSSAELPMKAAEVALNQEGYETIANLKNEREMLYFVKRVAKESGYQIANIGSLHGVVPYYSGQKATQSFLALQDELSRTAKQPKGWARKSETRQKQITHLIEIPSGESHEEKLNERGSKQISTNHHSKLSVNHEEDDKHESNLASKPEKKEKKQDKSSKKLSENNDDSEDTHEKKGSHHDTSKESKHSEGKKDEKDTSLLRANKKSKKHSAVEDAHKSLEELEVPELDETMLAEAAARKHDHTSKKSAHLDKKEDLSILRVVGKVKVGSESHGSTKHAVETHHRHHETERHGSSNHDMETQHRHHETESHGSTKHAIETHHRHHEAESHGSTKHAMETHHRHHHTSH